mmetsp:Transcript_33172/g.83639  ORF Transcript_33172/g.83639 Transcript_33172/m.83639 type:complete len:387 (+) Transcript_33172:335-1495(+)
MNILRRAVTGCAPSKWCLREGLASMCGSLSLRGTSLDGAASAGSCRSSTEGPPACSAADVEAPAPAPGGAAASSCAAAWGTAPGSSSASSCGARRCCRPPALRPAFALSCRFSARSASISASTFIFAIFATSASINAAFTLPVCSSSCSLALPARQAAPFSLNTATFSGFTHSVQPSFGLVSFCRPSLCGSRQPGCFSASRAASCAAERSSTSASFSFAFSSGRSATLFASSSRPSALAPMPSSALSTSPRCILNVSLSTSRPSCCSVPRLVVISCRKPPKSGTRMPAKRPASAAAFSTVAATFRYGTALTRSSFGHSRMKPLPSLVAARVMSTWDQCRQGRLVRKMVRAAGRKGGGAFAYNPTALTRADRNGNIDVLAAPLWRRF